MTSAPLVVLRFTIAVAGAVVFVVAGNALRDIESVSGTSIAESAYHAMGVFAYGMAALTVTLGLPTAIPAFGTDTDDQIDS